MGDNLESDIGDAARNNVRPPAPGAVGPLPRTTGVGASEASRVTTPARSQQAAPVDQFVHWTMAINLVLDNLERLGKKRFTDIDSQTMLQVKNWLDHQASQ